MRGHLWSPGAKKWVAVGPPLEGGNPAKPTARKRQMNSAFVQVPLKLAAEAFRANRAHKPFVFLWLLYLAWRSKSSVVSIPNGELERYGINRREKMKALRDYEKAGLLRVKKVGRQSVVAELLFAIGIS
jgi:hypothetical protein